MKTLITCLIFSMIVFSSCDKEKVVDETSLPSPAREFIEAHFPSVSISQVVRDRDDLTTSYDVILDNQVKLEFDKSGDVKSVEGTRTEKVARFYDSGKCSWICAKQLC